ncbi:dynamin family protein [Lysinibacillus capsici]|uniref:dynamin family protein n=1 Tax=Lysinibacillus capsici TaxID=2115968 RepID=UPI001C113A85|nr:dynamin family protein [Lysinibacillus capsici]MBU5250391.1 dynamin family protein [Lysinibacillus capsici]
MVVKNDYKEKIQQLLDEAESAQSKRYKITWNSTIDRYVSSLVKTKTILGNSNLTETVAGGTLPKIDSYISQCVNPEFHIAIIGVVKAGKSTLINALLGKNLASTAVTPETAVLTKFRSGKGKNFVKIKFYTTEDWTELWSSVKENTGSTFFKEYQNLKADNEKDNWLNHKEVYAEFTQESDLKEFIKEWTSSQEPKHYFVKEVEVGLQDFNLPDHVVFVDTPGLNDVVRYRSDVTRRYIDRANAVILCALSKTLNTGDLQAIYSVFANCRYNPQKVYILGTQVDLLNDPDEEWLQLKAQWVRYFEYQDCYGSRELAEHNIYGLSAYLYNSAINFEGLNRKAQRIFENTVFKYVAEEVDDISDTELIKVAKKISKIKDFEKTLFKEIIDKHETLLLEELKARFETIQNDLVDQFIYIKNSQQETLAMADKGLDEVIKQQKMKQEELKLVQQEQKSLENALLEIRLATSERTKALRDKMKALI